jgi:hypothetical protein
VAAGVRACAERTCAERLALSVVEGSRSSRSSVMHADAILALSALVLSEAEAVEGHARGRFWARSPLRAGIGSGVMPCVA